MSINASWPLLSGLYSDRPSAAPIAGQFFYSTDKEMLQPWNGSEWDEEIVHCVKTQVAVQAGDTIANTTVATKFATRYTMPANFLTVGRSLRLEGRGHYGTATLSPGTLRLELLADSQVLGDTGAQALVVNLADRVWVANVLLACTTLGSSGEVQCEGFVLRSIAATQVEVLSMVNITALTFDTTIAREFAWRITWSNANANNTITQRLLSVEAFGGR